MTDRKDEGWKAPTLMADARDEVLEEAAKVCERPIHHQHPTKPLGVVISITPPSPAHAAAIRALKQQKEESNG